VLPWLSSAAKGNALYLVHNVRRGGKVRQLHLARLGARRESPMTLCAWFPRSILCGAELESAA